MLRSLFSKPYSRLFIVGDNSGWSTDIDALDLKNAVKKLGVPVQIVKRMYLNLPQAVHYTSQFSLLLDIYKSKNRISLDYFHGKPEQQESFKKCFEAMRAHKEQIARVRVSNREMEQLIGQVIGQDKVMRIPIGVDTKVFKPANSKLQARSSLGIPVDAVVIGSFQKDGNGWGEGNEPKLIKGPDIFLQVVERLKTQIPNLFILLSGPARGFMKSGLEKIGVPYLHLGQRDYREVAKLYEALDLYIVASREEGGPKAVLESMASGVPLVTTAVGQAKDLVNHAQNAMMAPVEAVDLLAQYALEILKDKELSTRLIEGGLKTAQANNLESQIPLWQEYLKKLITG